MEMIFEQAQRVLDGLSGAVTDYLNSGLNPVSYGDKSSAEDAYSHCDRVLHTAAEDIRPAGAAAEGSTLQIDLQSATQFNEMSFLLSSQEPEVSNPVQQWACSCLDRDAATISIRIHSSLFDSKSFWYACSD
jgi:hypothetical protein